MKIGASINLYDIKTKKEAIYELLCAIEEMMKKVDFYWWHDLKNIEIKEDKKNKIITFEVKGERNMGEDVIIQINVIYEKEIK